MSKFTPGPWIADSVNTLDDSVTAVWQNDGRGDYYLRTAQVCECLWSSQEDRETGENDPTLAEAEANARLIAAAPDLLSALVESNKILHSLPATCDLVRAICANDSAIAKATGEQP